ncbi:MAG TPA: hypothetical protein VHY75_09590 [Steroidobacteraceae bacterium]|nr:hypothetical protein [Steroidobacteraceae bacterium]
MLPSGDPVVARREGDLPVMGAAAACANCHRRSGLGETEGRITIPPISAPYLFHRPAAQRSDLDVPYVAGMRINREPYTAATFARAVREGVGVDGEELSRLMPRYAMSDADLAAVLDYLISLEPFKAPGVTGSTINFATLITPDADPVKRRALLSVLEPYFAEQDAAALAKRPEPLRSPTLQLNARRRWRLHVWELTGPPATWEAQLRQRMQREPVYAVISGVSGAQWSPVHRFCESAKVPCILPNVDLPVVAEQDFYSIYFSRGVLLEAGLLAQRIGSAPRPRGRVVQVYRAGDIGEAAAKAMQAALAGSGIKTIERPVRPGGAASLARALGPEQPGDSLILWLRPPDVAALNGVPVRTGQVYLSGLMSGLEAAPVPPSWRRVLQLTYPAELPDRRSTTVDYALGWFAHNRIPVLDGRLQVDTYVACSAVLETLTEMGTAFAPEYLVERMEGMLDHQIVSGYYPRLSLAPDERFASKGGYIVHFAEAAGSRLLPDTEWLDP